MSENTFFVSDLDYAIAKARLLASALRCETTVLHSESGYCFVKTLDWVCRYGYVEGVDSYEYVTTLDREGKSKSTDALATALLESKMLRIY